MGTIPPQKSDFAHFNEMVQEGILTKADAGCLLPPPRFPRHSGPCTITELQAKITAALKAPDPAPQIDRPQPIHPDWINLLLGLVFALAFAGQFPRAVPWAQAILILPCVGVLWRQWQATRPLPPQTRPPSARCPAETVRQPSSDIRRGL